MPINTAEDLSRKELDLLEKQRQAARRRECQKELVLLQEQAQIFINMHVAHLQQLNSMNNEINIQRIGSLKYKLFREASHGQAGMYGIA